MPSHEDRKTEARLPKGLVDAEHAEHTVVTGNRTPIVQEVPFRPGPKRPVGFVEGRIGADFDAELPDGELLAWEP